MALPAEGGVLTIKVLEARCQKKISPKTFVAAQFSGCKAQTGFCATVTGGNHASACHRMCNAGGHWEERLRLTHACGMVACCWVWHITAWHNAVIKVPISQETRSSDIYLSVKSSGLFSSYVQPAGYGVRTVLWVEQSRHIAWPYLSPQKTHRHVR